MTKKNQYKTNSAVTKKKKKIFCPYAILKKLIKKIKILLASENYHILIIAGLVLSITIIFIALDIMNFPFNTHDTFSFIICLGNTRHTLGVLFSLLLIPLCACKIRFAYLLTLILSTIIFLLCLSHVFYMLIYKPYFWDKQIHGPVIWSFFQLPIIFYGFKAYKEAKNNG